MNPMNKEEAYQLIDKALASLNTDRATHTLLINALEVLRSEDSKPPASKSAK